MFDFATILERTEKRVEVDLLGAGPKTVDELKSIAGRLRIKYQNQLDRKIQRAQQQEQMQREGKTGGIAPPAQIKDVMDKASNMAGGLFAKMKNPVFKKPAFPSFGKGASTTTSTTSEPPATIVDLPPPSEPGTAAAATTPAPAATAAPGDTTNASEGDWAGTDILPATDAISNFSIGDDDDDDIL